MDSVVWFVRLEIYLVALLQSPALCRRTIPAYWDSLGVPSPLGRQKTRKRVAWGGGGGGGLWHGSRAEKIEDHGSRI